MPYSKEPLNIRKRIALIAHDSQKPNLLDWAHYNRGSLEEHELFATGTTGGILADNLGLEITRFRSGPLGGDQQIGAAIVEGRIDAVIFFWDPMEPQPHDVDVKALLRIAVLYNVPIACNRASADFILSSPLMRRRYERMSYSSEDTVGVGSRDGEQGGSPVPSSADRGNDAVSESQAGWEDAPVLPSADP